MTRSERAQRRSARAQRFDFGGVGFELLGATMAMHQAELESFAHSRGTQPVIADVLCAVNEDPDLSHDGGSAGVTISTRGDGAHVTAAGLHAELRRVGPVRFACSARIARGASLAWLAGVLAPVIVAAVQTLAAEQAASAGQAR